MFLFTLILTELAHFGKAMVCNKALEAFAFTGNGSLISNKQPILKTYLF